MPPSAVPGEGRQQWTLNPTRAYSPSRWQLILPSRSRRRWCSRWLRVRNSISSRTRSGHSAHHISTFSSPQSRAAMSKGL